MGDTGGVPALTPSQCTLVQSGSPLSACTATKRVLSPLGTNQASKRSRVQQQEKDQRDSFFALCSDAQRHLNRLDTGLRAAVWGKEDDGINWVKVQSPLTAAPRELCCRWDQRD